MKCFSLSLNVAGVMVSSGMSEADRRYNMDLSAKRAPKLAKAVVLALVFFI